jgi:hypothetical protein
VGDAAHPAAALAVMAVVLALVVALVMTSGNGVGGAGGCGSDVIRRDKSNISMRT